MLLVIVIVLAFGGSCFFGQARGPINATGIDIINHAGDYILSRYVDKTKLNSQNMTRAAIEGIISSLHNPYTAYISPTNYSQFVISFQGEYTDIGAFVSLQNEKVVIVS